MPPRIIKVNFNPGMAAVQLIWLKEAIHNGDAYCKHGLPEVARKKQFPLRNIYLILKQELSKFNALYSRHISFS